MQTLSKVEVPLPLGSEAEQTRFPNQSKSQQSNQKKKGKKLAWDKRELVSAVQHHLSKHSEVITNFYFIILIKTNHSDKTGFDPIKNSF